MKRNVLIATYYWPPSGGPGVQRYLKFAKYLTQFDVEPVILTVSNPTYPIRDESLVAEIPPDLKVYKSKTIEPFRLYAGLRGSERIKPTAELEGDSLGSTLASWIRANIFIPDARAGWLLTAARKATRIIREHGIDTIITTGPPHSVHFIGKYLQQKEEIRWLADFRDPWSQVYYNQLLPRTELAEQVDERLEQMVLAQADEVIVVSRSQAENFRKLVERGYHVITNGFDHEDFELMEPESREGERTRYLIRHIGNIGEGAVPEQFLQVIGELHNSLGIEVEFVGNVHNRLHRLIKTSGLEGAVRCSDYLPHHQALQKMCSADALLICIPDVENIEHHIPGKLFEYLGSGRPILMLGPTEGDSAEIIRDEKAGTTVAFHDSEGIGKALESLVAGEFSSRETTARPDHPYSRLQLTRKLSGLIHEEDLYPENLTRKR